MDEINALYTKTAYHDTDSQVLDAHRLRLPRTILDYFAGNKQFVSVIELSRAWNSDTLFANTFSFAIYRKLAL